jgi:hypothetical protein
MPCFIVSIGEFYRKKLVMVTTPMAQHEKPKLKDYLQRVEWAGRAARKENVVPYPTQSHLSECTWRRGKASIFPRCAGRNFIKGIRQSKALCLKPVTE